MDFSLTAEQELIRGSAREFCEREIGPYARDWDRAEELDREIVAKLAVRATWARRLRPSTTAWASTLSRTAY